MTPTTGLDRVAVVRLLRGLGDMLCLVPALRSLRRANPAARIDLFSVGGSEWMVDRFASLVDSFRPIGWWSGIPEANASPRTTRATLAEARSAHYDIAVQLHGTGWFVNELVAAIEPRVAAGYHPPGEPSPGPFFRPWPENGHEIHRLLAIATLLGCPDDGDHLEFPELAGDRDDAAAVLDVLGGEPFAVVHPGASRPDRRWSPAGFAGVIDDLHRTGVRAIVTGSPAERQLCDDVVHRCRRPPLPAVGKTSLGALGALAREASVVVANDTGVAHLGVAVGTPTTVIATTSDIARWGPIDRVTHRVVDVGGTARCEIERDVARVSSAVDQQLRQATRASR